MAAPEKYLGSAFVLSASPHTVTDPELLEDVQEVQEVKLPATLQDAKVGTNTFELGTPREDAIRGSAAKGGCSLKEEEDLLRQLRDAPEQLASARRRQREASALEKQMQEEIQRRDLLIAELREELS